MGRVYTEGGEEFAANLSELMRIELDAAWLNLPYTVRTIYQVAEEGIYEGISVAIGYGITVGALLGVI